MSRLIILRIPGTHPSLNDWTRLHYKKSWELKKYWEQLIGYKSNHITKDRDFTKIKKGLILIKYYFPNGNRRDPDNYTPKFILDGLVKAGILKDDSWRNITLVLEYPEFNADKEETEITIIERDKIINDIRDVLLDNI